MKWHSAMKNNEGLIHATAWMNLENIMLDTKGHIFYDSVYMNYPELANHREREREIRLVAA